MLCYQQEKEEHQKLMAQVAEAYRLMRQQDQPITEQTSLLQAEAIPLEEMRVYERGETSGMIEETMIDECVGGYEEIQGTVINETPNALPSNCDNPEGACGGDTYQACDGSSEKLSCQRDAKVDNTSLSVHQSRLQYLMQHSNLPREVLEQLTPEEIDYNLGIVKGAKKK